MNHTVKKNDQLVLFQLNIWRRSSVLQCDLIHPLKYPYRGPRTNRFNFLSEHISEAHWPTDTIYQVWSKLDGKCRRSSLFKLIWADNTIQLYRPLTLKRVTRILFDLDGIPTILKYFVRCLFKICIFKKNKSSENVANLWNM